MLVLLVGLAGCKGTSSKKPKVVGGDLPVASSSSVALPGATDAADAPHAPSVAESGDANLTTYRDPGTGVSFRYPTIWRPAVGQVLPAPAFAAVAGAPRMTQQFTPEGTPYADTVLRAMTFSYTAKAGLDQAGCADLPVKIVAGATQPGKVFYGATAYTEASGGDAAMCTQVKTRVDTTLRGGQCLVFERDIVTSCPFVKSTTLPRPLTAGENAALQQHLDAVMQSVQIAPK